MDSNDTVWSRDLGDNSDVPLLLALITSEWEELVALQAADVVVLQVKLAQLPQAVEGVVQDRLDVRVVEKQNFQVLPSDKWVASYNYR